MRRRDFLKVVGAAATSGALAGCATSSEPRKPIGRVIVIGGGYGGATAARYLRKWSGGTVQVFLVDREPNFVSCPLSNLVLGGSRSIDYVTRSRAKLRDEGVQVLQDVVTGIDRAKKTIQLTKIQDLSYDRLVLSPGVDFMFDQLPGLNNTEAQKQVLHAWKAGPDTVALRGQLEAMPDGGVFVLSIPKAPYRCPPGPYERACQVASYFKKSKPRSKVIVLDANEDVISKGPLFKAVWNNLYKGIIDYRNNAEAKDVDVAGRIVVTDFDKIKGDVLNVIPPMRAADIARTSGLITANNRWCGVNWQTTQSEVDPNIYILGDATLSAPVMPKSGHMANQHAKVAAAAIINALTGVPPNPEPMVMNTCYSFVSDTDVIHVASVHRWDAEKKTLMTVPGSGGVSTGPSAIEGENAHAWAQNIWNDMLG
ncbi:MAG: FCSD flavin-binding domain-containing protein [Burkholderiales bacterium]